MEITEISDDGPISTPNISSDKNILYNIFLTRLQEYAKSNLVGGENLTRDDKLENFENTSDKQPATSVVSGVLMSIGVLATSIVSMGVLKVGVINTLIICSIVLSLLILGYMSLIQPLTKILLTQH